MENVPCSQRETPGQEHPYHLWGGDQRITQAAWICKSHVYDAFVMGKYQPKHRAKPECYQKKRRNNRILEKFYDAKYIDSRDGKKKTGRQLANSRINQNHKRDTRTCTRSGRKKCRRADVPSGRGGIRSGRMIS